jgi:hypothetical protein
MIDPHFTVITSFRDGTPHDHRFVDTEQEARALVTEEARWSNTAWAGCPEIDFVLIGDFADDAIA